MAKIGGSSAAGVDQFGNVKLNQDAFRCINKTGMALLVCADGAGSSIYGAVGATRLVTNVIKRLSKLHSDADHAAFLSAITIAIEFTRASIQKYCSKSSSNIQLNDFAATLAAVCVTNDRAYFAHLGDGAILFLDDDNELICLSPPENGEYANQTFFFTDLHWKMRLRTEVVSQEFTSCLVMTDGVTPFALKKDGIFSDFTNPILKFLNSATRSKAEDAIYQTLASDKSLSISKDDKTLLWYLFNEG